MFSPIGWLRCGLAHDRSREMQLNSSGPDIKGGPVCCGERTWKWLMSDGEVNSVSDASGKHSPMTFGSNDENRFKVRAYHYLSAPARAFGASMTPYCHPHRCSLASIIWQAAVGISTSVQRQLSVCTAQEKVTGVGTFRSFICCKGFLFRCLGCIPSEVVAVPTCG